MDTALTGRRQNHPTPPPARLACGEHEATAGGVDITSEVTVLRAEVDDLISRVDMLIARRLAECRQPPERQAAP